MTEPEARSNSMQAEVAACPPGSRCHTSLFCRRVAACLLLLLFQLLTALPGSITIIPTLWHAPSFCRLEWLRARQEESIAKHLQRTGGRTTPRGGGGGAGSVPTTPSKPAAVAGAARSGAAAPSARSGSAPHSRCAPLPSCAVWALRCLCFRRHDESVGILVAVMDVPFGQAGTVVCRGCLHGWMSPYRIRNIRKRTRAAARAFKAVPSDLFSP